MRAAGAGRKAWGAGSLAAALSAVLAWTGAAWSAPQTFNSAITLVPGEFVVREQYVFDQSGDDPSGADRDREVKGVISVLGYAVDRDLMLFGVLPYLEKRLELTEDGGRRARSARGVADLRLFGRYACPASARGRGPPVAQSRSSTVCTTGIRVALASWTMQPMLPVATRSAPTRSMLATVRSRRAVASSGWSRL